MSSSQDNGANETVSYIGISKNHLKLYTSTKICRDQIQQHPHQAAVWYETIIIVIINVKYLATNNLLQSSVVSEANSILYEDYDTLSSPMSLVCSFIAVL